MQGCAGMGRGGRGMRDGGWRLAEKHPFAEYSLAGGNPVPRTEALGLQIVAGSDSNPPTLLYTVSALRQDM